MTPSERVRKGLMLSTVSRYAIARTTGISESVLTRFAAGRPISLANFDKLAAYLGLIFVVRGG